MDACPVDDGDSVVGGLGGARVGIILYVGCHTHLSQCDDAEDGCKNKKEK